MLKLPVNFVLSSIAVLFFIDVAYTVAGVTSDFTAASILNIALMIFLFIGLFNNKYIKSTDIIFLVVLAFICLLHFVNAPDSDVPTFIKLMAPVIFFFSGYSINTRAFFGKKRKLQKLILIAIVCGLPPLVRIYQLVTHDTNGNFSIFVNSNNFAYYIFVGGTFIYFLTDNKKYFWYFIIFCVLLSKTLGAVFALLVSAFIFYRRTIFKFKGVFILSLIILTFVCLTAYSDITIFSRIRDTLTTFLQLKSNYSVSSLQNISYADASKYETGGTEDLSFLFRLKNWTEIVLALLDSKIDDVLFGHGLMTVPKITSTGLVAHNDYLGLLYEMGLIYFLFILFAYFRLLKKLGKYFISIPFIGIAIYHFTENLYYNFLVTSLSFFLMGMFYNKYIKNKDVNEGVANK